MADILTRCPKIVRDGSPTLDTLYAKASFKGEDSVVVEVPPVIDRAVIPVASMVGSPATKPLTPGDGSLPPREETVGWGGAAEGSVAEIFRERAAAIQEIAPSINPAAIAAVADTAKSVNADLDKIRDIYSKWNNATMSGEGGSNEIPMVYLTPSGMGRLTLWQSVNQIKLWARPVTTATNWFANFSSLLGGETGGWSGGVYPTAANFWAALRAARATDRERIRSLYQRVIRTLWCGEYWIATSESYAGNKKIYESRPLPKMTAVLGSTPFRLESAVYTPSDQDQGHLPSGGLSTAVPPDDAPGSLPAPTVEEAWHQTPGGRAALVGGGVLALGGLAYGAYRIWTRRTTSSYVMQGAR